MRKQPIAFFDLDTVWESKSKSKFVDNADDVQIKREIVSKLAEVNNKGYFLIGLTDQTQVAQGKKTVQDVIDQIKMTDELLAKCYPENRTPFYALFFNVSDPKGTHPEFTYKSLFKKPHYGLIVLAEYDLMQRGIYPDYDRSFFVGDDEKDTMCAKNIGVEFVIIDRFLGKVAAAWNIPDVKVPRDQISLNDEEDSIKTTTDPTKCCICGKPHNLTDSDAGSERELSRLCTKCYEETKQAVEAATEEDLERLDANAEEIETGKNAEVIQLFPK